MAGTSLPTSGSARPPRGRSRTKFLLISSLLLLGLGFFGGVSVTKRAMTGPAWVQRVFGIELPPPEQVIVTPPKPTAPPVVAQPPAPVSPPVENHVDVPAPAAKDSAHTNSASAADPEGFVGRWEITDEVQAGDGTPTKILSGYVFNADGTGEFNTNGKKMYGLRWVLSGDFLTLTYDNEQSPQGEDGAIRMRWSVTPDKTLLTLVPENGKDARATLYSVGPGVYHKK
jgi:hypothetical protein